MGDKCHILYLPMKRKWFDMVLSGEKKEEYREVKPHWTSRLEKLDSPNPKPLKMCFVNGYQKNARRFYGYCDRCSIRHGEAIHPEWGEGEYAGRPHYVFHIAVIEKEGET